MTLERSMGKSSSSNGTVADSWAGCGCGGCCGAAGATGAGAGAASAGIAVKAPSGGSRRAAGAAAIAAAAAASWWPSEPLGAPGSGGVPSVSGAG